MTMAILRFNFAAPQDDPAARRDRIRAALELSSWSETRGVSAVSFDEHHPERTRLEQQSDHDRGGPAGPHRTRRRQRRLRAWAALAPGTTRRGHRPCRHHWWRTADRHTGAGLPARGIRVVRNAVRGPRPPDGRPPRNADVAVVVRRLHPGTAHAPAPHGVRRRKRPRHRAAGRQVRPTAQPAQPPARTRRVLPRTVCRCRAQASRRHAATSQSRHGFPARGPGSGVGRTRRALPVGSPRLLGMGRRRGALLHARQPRKSRPSTTSKLRAGIASCRPNS